MLTSGDRTELVADRYRRVRTIGVGAMGEVWLADDLVLERLVAIKEIRVDRRVAAEAESVSRMMREAKTAAKLHHRNIVSVFDLQTLGGSPCVVMEYVDGENLAEIMARTGPLPAPRAAEIIGQVATALAFAHRRGVVHRDVKPANILIEDGGEAKLADFGIARGLDDASLTQTGHMIGTMAFMAPEVARGDTATPASDVWSLGATLFAAIEGRAPFANSVNTAQMLLRLVSEAAPALTRAPEWTDLAARMLAAEPEERPAADEVARLLGSPPVVHAPTVPEPTVSVAEVPKPEVQEGEVPEVEEEPVTRVRPAAMTSAGSSESTDAETATRSGAASKRRRWPWAAALGIVVVLAAGAVTLVATQGGSDTGPPSSVRVSGGKVPGTRFFDIEQVDATVRSGNLRMTVQLAEPYDPEQEAVVITYAVPGSPICALGYHGLFLVPPRGWQPFPSSDEDSSADSCGPDPTLTLSDTGRGRTVGVDVPISSLLQSGLGEARSLDFRVMSRSANDAGDSVDFTLKVQ